APPAESERGNTRTGLRLGGWRSATAPRPGPVPVFRSQQSMLLTRPTPNCNQDHAVPRRLLARLRVRAHLAARAGLRAFQSSALRAVTRQWRIRERVVRHRTPRVLRVHWRVPAPAQSIPD